MSEKWGSWLPSVWWGWFLVPIFWMAKLAMLPLYLLGLLADAMERAFPDGP